MLHCQGQVFLREVEHIEDDILCTKMSDTMLHDFIFVLIFAKTYTFCSNTLCLRHLEGVCLVFFGEQTYTFWVYFTRFLYI